MLAGTVCPAAFAVDEDSPPADGQIRIEGRIRAVAPDRQSLEVEVIFITNSAGQRKKLKPAVFRTVHLQPNVFVVDRKDRELFHTPADLQAHGIVSIDGMELRGVNALSTDEVRVGGELRDNEPTPNFNPPPGTFPKPRPLVKHPVPIRVAAHRGLAKFEPRNGCYLGAFVMRDENVNSSMARFEEVVGKGHASYLRYVGYGQPFPQKWVDQVRSVGAVPNIAFEPNFGLAQVEDDAYLRDWSRAAGLSGGPVFLRFASEMNGNWTAYHGDPALYRQKFRLVAGVMRKEAPNVAMVWTPYCMPDGNIPSYYPGDDAVDWVGVNIYSVHHHDGTVEHFAGNEDPTQLLAPVYRRYAARKPIQISEYAATHFCQACGTEMPAFAVQKMTRMYRSLPARFPRVKMIYWFSWDTISGKAAANNYAVTDDPLVLSTYQSLVANPYFLQRLPYGRPRTARGASAAIERRPR